MSDKMGLRELRESKNKSRLDIEKMTGIKGQNLYKWENCQDKVPVEMAILLAKILKVKVKDIDWSKPYEKTTNKKVKRK